jgi:hypothetical protein
MDSPFNRICWARSLGVSKHSFIHWLCTQTVLLMAVFPVQISGVSGLFEYEEAVHLFKVRAKALAVLADSCLY